MSPKTSSQEAAAGAARPWTARYTCCQERGAMARPAAAAMARASAAQRGDLRAGAAPLTAPRMTSTSLMQPSGHPGPQRGCAGACHPTGGQPQPRLRHQ
eukprot:5440039-Alexandrium_andersonii.AAC.1